MSDETTLFEAFSEKFALTHNRVTGIVTASLLPIIDLAIYKAIEQHRIQSCQLVIAAMSVY